MRTVLPLWLFAILPTTAMAAPTPTIVEVHLANFHFTPSQIVLAHGQDYILRLVNDGGGSHDFTAKRFFAASALNAQDRKRLAEGEVEVPGHEVREIRLTAPAAGTFDLKCSHAFHKAFGMKGKIIVR